MRLASADFIVWLIIFAVVALAKAWSRLQQQIDEDSSAPPPKPPVAKRPLRPRLLPPQPRKPGGGTDLRDFMEQLQRKLQPQPVARAAPPPTPPPAPKPEAPPTAPKAEPPLAAAVSPSRTSAWTEALRDKQNIRNIIISAEIIGPPKGA